MRGANSAVSGDLSRVRDMTAEPWATRGVIMAATGERYMAMARNAAESVKRHSPALPIHLYADADASAPCFDRVTRLERPWRRSKIDAMIAAPFERNLFLDADVFVVADVSDVLETLDRFDISLAHDQERNSRHATTNWRREFPASFPQFNSGVIAYRRSDAVLALLRAWRDAVREDDLQRDQGALRELLWYSDLRIATLPPEYNLLDMSSVWRLSGTSLAPRVIHHHSIHHGSQRGVAESVEDLLGSSTSRAIRFMGRRDHFLSADAARVKSGPRAHVMKLFLQVWMILESAVARLLRLKRRRRTKPGPAGEKGGGPS